MTCIDIGQSSIYMGLKDRQPNNCPPALCEVFSHLLPNPSQLHPAPLQPKVAPNSPKQLHPAPPSPKRAPTIQPQNSLNNPAPKELQQPSLHCRLNCCWDIARRCWPICALFRQFVQYRKVIEIWSWLGQGELVGAGGSWFGQVELVGAGGSWLGQGKLGGAVWVWVELVGLGGDGWGWVHC